MSAVPQRAPGPSNVNLAGRSVLVIEDNPDSRDLLSQVLRALRARVYTARNIADAELEVARHRPDLIVCDVKLPDGTGFDFISWLRGQSKATGGATPCIAVTGYDDYFPPTTAAGFDAYLPKPVNLDVFCDLAVTLSRR